MKSLSTYIGDAAENFSVPRGSEIAGDRAVLPEGAEEIVLRRGEIIGLAGLEGSGQQSLLHAIFSSRSPGVERRAAQRMRRPIVGREAEEGGVPLDAFYAGDVASYLHRYTSGESEAAFSERQALAQFSPLLGDALDAVAGELMEALPRVERDWGSLGDPTVPGTVAYRISRDVDGSGMDYDVAIHRGVLTALLYNEVWAVVEGPSGTAEGKVRILPPTAVPNWTEVDGGLEDSHAK